MVPGISDEDALAVCLFPPKQGNRKIFRKARAMKGIDPSFQASPRQTLSKDRNNGDDPILQARSAAYMRSFSLRSGEKSPVPAITPSLTAAPGDAEGKKS